MQTDLAEFFKQRPEAESAERILRTCVHCGFCLATCPTYQLLGDEQDSPRGRIYLMKQALEGAPATRVSQLHLDRCLTCRACETTCPSGVEYGHLVDIGREVIEEQVRRPARERAQRWLLRKVLPRRKLFSVLLGLGRTVRPLLPAVLKEKVPVSRRRPPPAWPAVRQAARKVLMLEGCVQPALEPSINPSTARLLDALGLTVVRTPGSVCCGAVSQHLTAPEEAQATVRRTIDAWWPHIEAGEIEAIVVNASGCGVQVKEYGHLLRHDPEYAEKGRRVSALTRDPIELLETHADRLMPAPDAPKRIAFQAPCTLQHGQKLPGRVEVLLRRIGFELTPVPDAHLCCGSAGTYSVLQADLSKQLRANKLAALGSGAPELIATANIGCLTHLDAASTVPVRHWLELVTVKPE
jgi:glycolate oxidase iron-sulfur subunit